MPFIDPNPWSALLGRTLARFGEDLMRQVADELIKPRSLWPVEDLIERSLAAVGNAAVIDRRLKDLGQAERRLLALIGHSGQPRWRLVHLLEMLVALGHVDGVGPFLRLFQAGLLYPCLLENAPRLRSFEPWLGQASFTELEVFAHPEVTARTLGDDLGLPELPGGTEKVSGVREADGLEWLLRLAVLWQQVAECPLRRTQNEGFFKRDLDRLRQDPVLNSSPAVNLADLPDTGLLAVALGGHEGLLQKSDGEWRAGGLPAAWDNGLPAALAALWSALPHLATWNPQSGWCGTPSLAGNPYPSAYLLALLLLAHQREDAWFPAAAVGQWVLEHHPHWAGRGARSTERKGRTGGDDALRAPRSALDSYLLGFTYQLRLLQAARTRDGADVIRVSPLGRWLLGMGPMPATGPAYPKTLLVQPNLEILVYRQGLTPELIGRLTRFAAWKSLGAACTLQLQPDSVYRALELGETYASIVQTLERHGMKGTPGPVLDSLKTWANKHERIGVYPSAVLLEFGCPEHLNEALARGLPAVRLSDRLAVVAREQDVNFQLFRLTGTRDYGLPPDRCVDMEPDGVTLTVDQARSDLLLETEVQRFAEPVADGQAAPNRGDKELVNGRRQYRLTPASLAAGRESGLSLTHLENWFVQRTGQPLSPAARLLLTGGDYPALELRRLHVVHVPTKELADGLLQWPATAPLIVERLGPTALAVAEEHIEELRGRLERVGVKLEVKQSV
jgi:hypothetical protein